MMATVEPIRWSNSDYASAVKDMSEVTLRGLAVPGRLLGQPSMRDTFLADILAHPEDDTPRLIYADWLDDNATSEAERARTEFIRLQCTGTGVRRWRELPLSKQEQAELGPWMPFYEQVRRAEWLLERHGLNWLRPDVNVLGGQTLTIVSQLPRAWEGTFQFFLPVPGSTVHRADVSWRWSRGWPNHLHLSPDAWLALGDHFLKTWPVTEVELTEPIQVRVDMRPGSANRFLSFVGDLKKRWLEVEERNWLEMVWSSQRDSYFIDAHAANCWPGVRFTVAQQPATTQE